MFLLAPWESIFLARKWGVVTCAFHSFRNVMEHNEKEFSGFEGAYTQAINSKPLLFAKALNVFGWSRVS